MKRIIHITSSLHRGGAEHVLAALLEQLQNYDHQVIYFHDGPVRQQIEALGIKTYQIKGAFALYDPWFIRQLYTTIKKLQPDCMHSLLWAANFCARIMARWLKIPLICAVHARAEHEGYLRTQLDKIFSLPPQHYVAVAPSIAASLATQRKIDPQRIKIIPNGITFDHHKKIIKKDNKIFIIGAVGRLVPVKNFAFLIRAFTIFYKNHSTARLIIVGGGPLEQGLKNLVKNYSLEKVITFTGSAPAHDYYSQFDCFAQLSHSEGLSIALLEALSYSLPVIVTGNNQQHDIIEHAITGFIIDHDNTDQLVNYWEQLCSNQQLRTQLGKAGAALVKNNYSAYQMAQQYDTLFKTTIANYQQQALA